VTVGRILGLVLVFWLAMQPTAYADTAHLRDGQTIWGREILEEGDELVIVRPGGNVRVPKAQVIRVDRLRTTLPPHYSPPAAAGAAPPGVSAAPPASAAAPPPAPAPSSAPTPGAAVPAASPTPAQPTALPPPPPPPSQQ
jgi:hypothetical protein